MLKYLIICPLVFIAGFIDSIAGGGGLISLPAYMLAGIPVHSCIATNKMSSFMGTSVSVGKYAKSGFIPWRYAIFAVPCAFLGSNLGARLALMISPDIFLKVMLAVIPLTALYVLLKKDLTPNGRQLDPVWATIFAMIIAFIVGMYDGFYGPGTGTFLILLLTGIARMELTQANGLSKVINWTTNLSSLLVYLINGKVLLPLGLCAGLFGIVGNYLGARGFEKGGTKIVRPVIIIVLILFFIKVSSEVFF